LHLMKRKYVSDTPDMAVTNIIQLLN